MNQNAMQEKLIIPAKLAIRSMRDSGYRDTACALAELIDNSIQANAGSVDVICTEKSELVKTRARRRINAIGVMDNGEGMSHEVLHSALQFGNGTHLEDRKGMGRFGMGLPNSSISQCQRVEVWTWQNGPDNALYSYLDVKEIEDGKMSSVPDPTVQPLPDKWKGCSDIVNTTGTFVLWTKFDENRLSWKMAETALRKTEDIIGRMYRKFIDGGLVAIQLVTVIDEGQPSKRYAKVNDPLYLMKNSSTPASFDGDGEPMFQPWGEGDEVFGITYNGEQHDVRVKMSWAKKETVPQDGIDRGAKKYGKHAAKNIGVSIVREKRELDLDTGWTIGYDPRERWWGVEVAFPSNLDEIFGVTNNKQSATIFSRLATLEPYGWESEKEDKESYIDFKTRIKEVDDPRALLLPISEHIQRQLLEIRKRLKVQTKNTRSGKNERYDEPSVADLATTKFNERAAQGYVTDADKEEFNEEDKLKLEKDLIEDKDYHKDVAAKIAKATFNKKRKVVFVTKAMDGNAFFKVEHNHGGVTPIVFNTNHPFHEQLIETLEPPKIGEETDADLIDRIHKATDTLSLLFAAWGRYEMEAGVHKRDELCDMREDWGRMAKFFLKDSSDD